MAKIECCYDFISSYDTGHAHGEYAHIFLPQSDTLYLRSGDTDYWLSSKDIAVVPPDVFHRIICTEKLIWFNLPCEMFKKEDAVYFEKTPVCPTPRYFQPLIALIRYETTLGPNSDAMRYLAFYLFSKLTAEHKVSSVRYIEAHYSERITIEMLAHLENYNVNYFISWFKNQTGMTPNDYLTMTRMNKARDLLVNTEQRIIEIALLVGYSSGTAFSRVFHSCEGMTPKEYRQKLRQSIDFSSRPYWPDINL